MTDRLRPFVAPLYLFLCLVLGGSAQGVWGNAALRLTAIAIILWALMSRRDQPLDRGLKQLLLLIACAILLILIQLIPIPWSMWTAMPGRERFASDFELLGVGPHALAISLAPYDSVATLLSLLPPLAMIAALVRLRGYSPAWLAVALVSGTFAAVLLGILQVTSGDAAGSQWYLYRRSNFGAATGFFANSNHMASLLLTSIPFLAALGATARERSKDVRLRSAALALAGGGLIIVILGLILNGSLAGYGLALPVVIATLLVMSGQQRRFNRLSLIAVAIGSLIALAILWASPVNRGGGTSVSSRQEIVVNSSQLLGQFGLTGTGLGTFEQVYRLTERPDQVGLFYVNHAHNDYLELAVETGLAGMILMLLFLAWWGMSAWQMARAPSSDQYAYAGCIASAALLLHSMVDFPLRTAAMSSVFAMCLVLMLQSRRIARSEKDLRPARHVVVG